MAQQQYQSSAESDRSSVSSASWISVADHSKHPTMPNSNLPVGKTATPGFAAGPIPTIHTRIPPTPIHNFDHISPMPINRMMPHPIPSHHLLGMRIGEQRQQPAPPPSLALHNHQGRNSPATALVVGSTTMNDTPVVAFVSDMVRTCCATERHALLQGHPNCLLAYKRAAEQWKLAQEAQAKRNSDNNGKTVPPSSPEEPHPFGAIGEKLGVRGFQQQQQQHNPAPVTIPGFPTPPIDFALPLQLRLHQMMGFGPPVPGEFRPMVSVRQANNNPTTTATTGMGAVPRDGFSGQPNDLNNQDGKDPLGSPYPLHMAATYEERIAMGYSPRYQGNIWLEANRCADIPDALNTSLFLIHLPPDLTTHRLLLAIHKLGPTGRIFALHINAPEPYRGNMGCAAKIVFFKRADAHLFFDLCHQFGFWVDGRRAQVTWNRIKTAERPDLVGTDASRVLLIAGPRNIVNPRTLTEFFRTKLEFQIDEIVVLDKGQLQPSLPIPLYTTAAAATAAPPSPPGPARIHGNPGDAIIEYRFGSFRCQAQAAKMALGRTLPMVRCFFGEDPLAPAAWRSDEYTRRTRESYDENLQLVVPRSLGR